MDQLKNPNRQQLIFFLDLLIRRLFSDYSAIIEGSLMLFTIINDIKQPLIKGLKISSYWGFHSVSAIIEHFGTILTLN